MFLLDETSCTITPDRSIFHSPIDSPIDVASFRHDSCRRPIDGATCTSDQLVNHSTPLTHLDPTKGSSRMFHSLFLSRLPCIPQGSIPFRLLRLDLRAMERVSGALLFLWHPKITKFFPLKASNIF